MGALSRPFYRGPQIGTSRDGRFYVWGGQTYWSVTTIIQGGLPKPALINWAKKFTAEYAVEHFDALSSLVADDPKGAVGWLKDAAYRDRDRKAHLGSAAHDAAEAYVLERPFPAWSDGVAPLMGAFVSWLEDWTPEFTCVEAPVFNRTQRYAGTLDAIVDMPDGQRLLMDWKTGKGVYPEVALQLAAYRYAETFLGMPDGSEAPMPEVDGAAVVHLRPDGTYQFVPVRADEECFRAFLFCREVFRFTQEIAPSALGAPLEIPDDARLRRLEASVEATAK